MFTNCLLILTALIVGLAAADETSTENIEKFALVKHQKKLYYPYMAEIYVKLQRRKYLWRCVGILITFKYAITASSCYDRKYKDKQWFLTAGVRFKCCGSARGQMRQIVAWIFYEGKPEGSLDKNVALVKAKESFQIKPLANFIRLAPKSELNDCDLILKYKRCYMVASEEVGFFGHYFVKIESIGRCGQSIVGEYVKNLTSSYTCTATPGLNVTHPACLGSLGSPLICGGQVAGFMIKKFGCSNVHRALFLRVDRFQRWISRSSENSAWYVESKQPMQCTKKAAKSVNLFATSFAVKSEADVLLGGVLLVYVPLLLNKIMKTSLS